MNKIIEPLFLEWIETHKDTPEYDRVADVFCEPNENITLKQANDNFDLLVACVFAESEQAFCAGFKTAVQLLMVNE